MARYPALIDGAKGAYGVAFPDLPGIVAMGATLEEAMLNAEAVLQDAALEAERDGIALSPPSALEEVDVPAGTALVVHSPGPRRTRAAQRALESDAGRRRCRHHQVRVGSAGYVAQALCGVDDASIGANRGISPDQP